MDGMSRLLKLLARQSLHWLKRYVRTQNYGIRSLRRHTGRLQGYNSTTRQSANVRRESTTYSNNCIPVYKTPKIREMPLLQNIHDNSPVPIANALP
jgi:hypothetical protein